MEIFISLVMGLTMYLNSIDMFIDDFREHKLSIARFVANMIKGEKHQKFTTLESIKTHEFQEYFRIISRIYEKEKYVRYIYTLNLDQKNNKLYYGIDATRLDEDTIWIESLEISFSAYVKNSKLFIEYNYDIHADNFKVKVPNHGELEIKIIQSPSKKLFIGETEIFEVVQDNPLIVKTKSGILDRKNRFRDLFVDFFQKETNFYLSFTEKGSPGSDPGALFVEREMQEKKIKELISAGIDFIDEKPTYKTYGTLMSAYSVIKNSDGQGIGIVIVDVEDKEVEKFKRRFVVVVIAISIIVFIISTFLSLLLAKFFTQPLEVLTGAVENLASGNLETIVRIESKDEFGKLAKSFNTMVENLKSSSDMQYKLLVEISTLNEGLEQKVREKTRAITLQSQELEKQIQIAKKIQISLLPRDIPEFQNATISFKYQPMMDVGGDFLDIYYSNEHELTLFICDVSGHGVPAAFLATMVKMSLKECYDLKLQPSESLQKIQQVLKGKMSGHFISATLCKIDLLSGTMISANAGHLPFIHVKGEGYAKYISSKGKVITDLFEPNPEEIVTHLNPGDKIILYTDGITEARNKSNEMFGDDRLLSLVSEKYQAETDHFCKIIYDSIMEYTGNQGMNHFTDDITLLVAEFKGPLNESIQ
jgi:serine phosphatase RsbU (regulator of sigma subunit)